MGPRWSQTLPDGMGRDAMKIRRFKRIRADYVDRRTGTMSVNPIDGGLERTVISQVSTAKVPQETDPGSAHSRFPVLSSLTVLPIAPALPRASMSPLPSQAPHDESGARERCW